MESWITPDTPSTTFLPRIRSALDAALDAVLTVIRTPAMSLDGLRGVVVRYGALAREQALQLDDMLGALIRSVGSALGALPAERQEEVLAFVQWWALHGYHRAD